MTGSRLRIGGPTAQSALWSTPTPLCVLVSAMAQAMATGVRLGAITDRNTAAGALGTPTGAAPSSPAGLRFARSRGLRPRPRSSCTKDPSLLAICEPSTLGKLSPVLARHFDAPPTVR